MPSVAFGLAQSEGVRFASTWGFTCDALGERAQWAYGSSGGTAQHLFGPDGTWLGVAGNYTLVTFGGRNLTVYQGASTSFNHVNALGSTTMWTNQSGAETEDILFYPWGDVWGSQGSGGYNFAELPYYDTTTMTELTTARITSPNFGRWFSPDPQGGHLEDPQTLNKYAYVRNNPTTLTDPSGLDFYLACQNSDDSGCTQVAINNNKQWVQADENGSATVITSDSIRAGQNSATVNGSGVQINGNNQGIYFDNPASHTTDPNGNDVNHNPITLQGDASKGLGGFSFNVNGNCGGTCLSSGSFQFNGTPDQARDALNAAGAWNYGVWDALNSTVLGHHPETDQFRFGSGPSLHVSVPWDFLGSMDMQLVPNPASTVPATGDWHTDETIGYSHFKHANVPGAQ